MDGGVDGQETDDGFEMEGVSAFEATIDSLRLLVCALLRKNQQLRLALQEAGLHKERTEGKDTTGK